MAGSNGTAKGTAKGSKSAGGRSLDGSHDDLPEKVYDRPGGSTVINEDAQIDAMAKNAGLSREEAAKSHDSIGRFTAGFYEDFRNVERGKLDAFKTTSTMEWDKKATAQKLAETQEKIRAINQYITKAPAYKGEIYRGMGFSSAEDQAGFLKSLGSKSLNAMSSFSSKSRVADSFISTSSSFGVVLKVVNNKSGVSIKNISQYKTESEVLVPKGTKYKIVKVTPRSDNPQILDVEVKEV